MGNVISFKELTVYKGDYQLELRAECNLCVRRDVLIKCSRSQKRESNLL